MKINKLKFLFRQVPLKEWLSKYGTAHIRQTKVEYHVNSAFQEISTELLIQIYLKCSLSV